jgi:DNA modification methylase
MEACLPHQRNHSRGKQEGEQTNRCYGNFGKADDCISDEKYPKSIVCYPNTVQDNIHPTQKPVDLLRYLILTYTNSGGVILDATIGSGTTAVAAIKEKRHFIGFELNKEYFDKAQERINKIRQNPEFDFK